MTVASSPQVHEYSPYDLSTRRFWSQSFDVRDQTFAALRAADGLTWHHALPTMWPVEEPGFWALTRRADIAYVSRPNYSPPAKRKAWIGTSHAESRGTSVLSTFQRQLRLPRSRA